MPATAEAGRIRAGEGTLLSGEAVGAAPAVDPRLAESEPRLVELLREEILASPDERITFARFMERALAEPGLGYYATSELRPTRSGDFLTAPELHPVFGRCIARFLAAVWARLGDPARFTVREYGAGRGTLQATALDGLRRDGSGLAGAIAWDGIDLPSAGLGRPSSPPSGPPSAAGGEFVGAVVANEFVDALPVHRLVVRGGALRETYVGWRNGWFADVEAEPSDAQLEVTLASEGIALAEGQVAEVRLNAPRWVERAAAGLRRGVMLVVDYGADAAELYSPRRLGGTLLGYRAHAAGDDPYRAVGRQDLTAHVDFTALERAGERAGLERLGSTSQARFLADLGLGQMLSELGRDAATDPSAYLLARASVVRLLDPRHLGAFGVLAMARDVPPGPPIAGLGAEWTDRGQTDDRGQGARSGTGSGGD